MCFVDENAINSPTKSVDGRLDFRRFLDEHLFGLLIRLRKNDFIEFHVLTLE